MEKINVSDLTPEQRRQMMEELKAEEKAAETRRKNEIEAYKSLVSQTVVDCFPRLQHVSETLAGEKRTIREAFAAVLQLKADLYGVKEGQRSHQFMSDDGTLRIEIGFNCRDNYDDTADTGVAMVKEYLAELGDSDNARQAVKLALSLLAKDQKGTLKASRIMTLRKHAQESGSAKFIEGVEIIMDAYRPIETKTYVRAERKDENGAWKSVPLGMTEAE